MKKFYLLILIIIFVVNANANANDGRLKKIYIDKSKNVNVISFDGKKQSLPITAEPRELPYPRITEQQHGFYSTTG